VPVQKSLKRKIVSLMLGILMVCGVCAQSAGAIDAIATNQAVTLTVAFRQNNKGVEGTTFKLYRVADVSRGGTYTETSEFDYDVLQDEMSSERWKAAAETYATYIERDGIQPLDTAVTDTYGKAQFPKYEAKLKPGLYLAVGEAYTAEDGTVYTPEPLIMSLPDRGEDGVWSYDVTAEVKYGVTEPSDTVDDSKLKVVKVWSDDGYESKRPTKVTVQLLRNGKSYQEVTLNEDNNWMYTWTDLDTSYKWSAVEKSVPSGYKVGVTHEGNTYTITNTYKTSSSSSSGSSGSSSSSGSSLPNTGMLWWPVSILVVAGLLIFTVGWIRYKKSEG
jgi:hypothetical protein